MERKNESNNADGDIMALYDVFTFQNKNDRNRLGTKPSKLLIAHIIKLYYISVNYHKNRKPVIHTNTLSAYCSVTK